MDALVELSWRAYPAAVVAALGLALAVQGGRRFVLGLRPPYGDAGKTLRGVQGFRRGMIGLAVAGLAGAWAWQADWLLVLSLVIGGEELLESTLHVQALRMSERAQRRRLAAGEAAGRAARRAG